MHNAILLISCPDQKGITATITNFIYENNGNIEHADQHIDSQSNTFFMRIEWSMDDFSLSRSEIGDKFALIAEKFNIDWSLFFTDSLPKAAIFVSKTEHCLYDLFLRYKSGQLHCQIPLIISNHHDLKGIAEMFNIPFFEFPPESGSKEKIEQVQIDLLKKEGIEVVVLARYMQVLGKRFVQQFKNKIINIHHSFLPAFIGKKPYAQAYCRGVKLIGATSHYVTEEIDSGPIIEQGIVRVSHRDSLNDLKTKGCDLEKAVLSRAVLWHLERKILVYNNKTVVFD
ncbi:MAG: formyltetrahydrofolate deformylase [Candidatus Omnitrophota bacterium]